MRTEPVVWGYAKPRPTHRLRHGFHTIEQLEPRIAMSADFAGAVGQLPGSSLLTGFLDTDRDPAAEIRYDFGLPNDQAVSGDWKGDGFDDLGMVRSQPNGYLQWFLDGNRDPHAEKSFYFGSRGDHVLVADFNGDGIDDIAVVRPNDFNYPTEPIPRLSWYIAKGPFDDVTDDTFAAIWTTKEYGFEGDTPVAGDWDNNGTATAGIVSQVPVYYGGVAWNRWYLEGSQPVDFGYPSDVPVVGDWDGNGSDNVGVVRERSGLTSLWYGDTNSDPASEVSFEFGLEGYQYVVGNWKADDTAPTAVVSRLPGPLLNLERASFVVRYEDDNYLDTPQLGDEDLHVRGPNGYRQLARLEHATGDGRDRLVTYSISAPGGDWDAADNGTYAIRMRADQVCDVSDNCVSTGRIGRFFVNFGSTGTTIVNEDFEDGSWTDSFDVCNCSLSEVTQTMSHGPGTHSFLTNLVGIEPEGTLDKVGLQFDSIYVSFYEKIPDGLPFVDDADLKLSRLAHDVGGFDLSLTVTYDPDDPEQPNPYFIAKINNSDREEIASWSDGPDRVREWFRVAYYMRYNDVGQDNGVLKVWFDDELKIDEADVDFRSRGAATADIMWVGGNLSRHAPPPSDPLERYIDDIVVIIDGDAPANGGATDPQSELTIDYRYATLLPFVRSGSDGSELTVPGVGFVGHDVVALSGAGQDFHRKSRPENWRRSRVRPHREGDWVDHRRRLESLADAAITTLTDLDQMRFDEAIEFAAG